MKRKFALLLGVFGMVAVLFMGSGCTKARMAKPDQAVLDAFDITLVEKTNDFGFNLYKNLARENENIMISPVSVSLAMAMVYNGANGVTREDMARALNVQGLELDRLNKTNLALLYYLTSADPELTLNIANSIWIKKIFIRFSQPRYET